MNERQYLARYESNLQRAVTYISQNLHDELSLDTLATVSCFSKFHFARLFHAFTGEPPGEFIRRLRLEKAAYLLLYNRQQSITDITYICGFSSSQNMARAFRTHYGLSPSGFRKRFGELALIDNTPSIKELVHTGTSTAHYINLLEGQKANYIQVVNDPHLGDRISIETMPAQQVIYAREVGRYQPKLILRAIAKLKAFAAPRKLISPDNTPFCVFWDNAATTDESQCRVDCCLAWHGDKTPTGIGTQMLAGGKMAFCQCEVTDGNFYAHWHAILNNWLPISGFVLDDRPCIETYQYLPHGTDDPGTGVKMRIGIPLV